MQEDYVADTRRETLLDGSAYRQEQFSAAAWKILASCLICSSGAGWTEPLKLRDNPS